MIVASVTNRRSIIGGAPTASRRVGMTLSFALLASVLSAAFYVQTPVVATGTWRAEGTEMPWEVVLRADGALLTGVVSSCATAGTAIPIVAGQLDASTVAFKCIRGDGVSALAFTGTISGDEMILNWVSQHKA